MNGLAGAGCWLLKEHFGGKPKSFFQDYVAELNKVPLPNGITQHDFELLLVSIFQAYEDCTKDLPVEYDTLDCNCSSFVNTILKIAGVSKKVREEVTEFSGVDAGEKEEFPQWHQDVIKDEISN